MSCATIDPRVRESSRWRKPDKDPVEGHNHGDHDHSVTSHSSPVLDDWTRRIVGRPIARVPMAKMTMTVRSRRMIPVLVAEPLCCCCCCSYDRSDSGSGAGAGGSYSDMGWGAVSCIVEESCRSVGCTSDNLNFSCSLCLLSLSRARKSRERRVDRRDLDL